MTLDQALHEVACLIDDAYERARDNDELLLIEHGATDDEIAATLAMRDALWREDRARQLQQARSSLLSWLERDGAALQ
jgi:hypothetical protein